MTCNIIYHVPEQTRSVFRCLLKKKKNLLHQDMERKPNIFILNGSVNSKHAHPPPPPSCHLSDICHFVLEKLQMPYGGAECSYKTPTVGFKNRVQMPHPRITPKLNNFPINKLQIPYLWEFSNNLLIKM